MTAFPQWLLHSVVMCHVHNTWHKVNTHQMTGEMQEVEIQKHRFQSRLGSSCVGRLTALSFPCLICKRARAGLHQRSPLGSHSGSNGSLDADVNTSCSIQTAIAARVGPQWGSNGSLDADVNTSCSPVERGTHPRSGCSGPLQRKESVFLAEVCQQMRAPRPLPWFRPLLPSPTSL